MYPNKKSNYRIHGPINISILSQKYVPFVPIRNPLDSVASVTAFMKYKNIESLEKAIDDNLNKYLNFYSYFLKYENKTIPLFFEKFTKDLSYIEKASKNLFNENTKIILDEDIKKKMNQSDFSLSLPRDNKEELNLYKQEIIKNNKYDISVDIFEYFKNKYYNVY